MFISFIYSSPDFSGPKFGKIFRSPENDRTYLISRFRLRMNPSQFSPSGKNVQGGGLSLLADLTQGDILSLKARRCQALFSPALRADNCGNCLTFVSLSPVAALGNPALASTNKTLPRIGESRAPSRLQRAGPAVIGVRDRDNVCVNRRGHYANKRQTNPNTQTKESGLSSVLLVHRLKLATKKMRWLFHLEEFSVSKHLSPEVRQTGRDISLPTPTATTESVSSCVPMKS